MAPPRKRQKVSTASQSTATSLSRNVSAASTHSTPPNTPPGLARPSPPQNAGIFSPEHVKHLIANLDVERTLSSPLFCCAVLIGVAVRDRTMRLRNHYNLLASTLRIRGEARMSRVPSHLRGVKIRELREMQKRGQSKEKQLYTEVMGTRLLASAKRPTLKRYFPPHHEHSLIYIGNLKTKHLIQRDAQVCSPNQWRQADIGRYTSNLAAV